jgi:hypothetical protein
LRESEMQHYAKKCNKLTHHRLINSR